jgi:putative ABC transport system permease protein
LSGVRHRGNAFAIWRRLLLAQLRESPARVLITVFAIALGVALGAAVYFVNGAALNEFGLASKRLVGEADLVVRAAREGFPESLYVDLARNPEVAAASPILELEVAVPGHRDTLKVLGVDPFRASAIQSALLGEIAGNVRQWFEPDGIFLSSSAADELHLRSGGRLAVVVGSTPKTLRVLGILSQSAYPQPLGIMDIASAQWLFGQAGRLNRIDLRLNPGTSVESFRTALARELPAGVLAVAPEVERDRAVTATRAYRVNLNMLAMVALWTGAFLVFSTQSLSVLRRRTSLAVLRALGVTRSELQRALLGEGAALGALGSLLGVAVAVLLADALLRVLSGDLGNGQMHATVASLSAAPLAAFGFFLIGTGVAAVGAWLPARAAAGQSPARALKGGGGDYAAAAGTSSLLGVALLAAGALLAFLPPVGGLPAFGYAAIAALLFGAVLLVPALTVRLLHLAPRTHQVVLNTAIAQLRDNVGLSTLSLASIIVSFSLMVAMAIMVYSFRESFDHWLGTLLPADLQLREPFGNDTAFWSPEVQARLVAVGGVARIEFRRTRQLLLDPARPSVTLIARDSMSASVGDDLPLVRTAAAAGLPHSRLVWISEALEDLYGYRSGDSLELPLTGRRLPFTIAGVWRDYARPAGAVVISRPEYVAATADRAANEASVWLKDGALAATVEPALRAAIADGGSAEIMTGGAVRERSLQIFDRAFAITYALEAIAVLIGLTGVSLAAGSTALARRAEFGVLRHLGMLRSQIVGMLAREGLLLGAFGVVYGLGLGASLSLVLVYVVNRQSFNWSIDLAVPYRQLAMISVTLLVAAAVTAVWSGRAAMSQDAVRAVREDW